VRLESMLVACAVLSVSLAAQDGLVREPLLGVALRDADKPWAEARVHAVAMTSFDFAIGTQDHVVAVADERGRLRLDLLAGRRYALWAEQPAPGPRERDGNPLVSRELTYASAGERVALGPAHARTPRVIELEDLPADAPRPLQVAVFAPASGLLETFSIDAGSGARAALRLVPAPCSTHDVVVRDANARPLLAARIQGEGSAVLRPAGPRWLRMSIARQDDEVGIPGAKVFAVLCGSRIELGTSDERGMALVDLGGLAAHVGREDGSAVWARHLRVCVEAEGFLGAWLLVDGNRTQHTREAALATPDPGGAVRLRSGPSQPRELILQAHTVPLGGASLVLSSPCDFHAARELLPIDSVRITGTPGLVDLGIGVQEEPSNPPATHGGLQLVLDRTALMALPPRWRERAPAQVLVPTTSIAHEREHRVTLDLVRILRPLGIRFVQADGITPAGELEAVCSLPGLQHQRYRADRLRRIRALVPTDPVLPFLVFVAEARGWCAAAIAVTPAQSASRDLAHLTLALAAARRIEVGISPGKLERLPEELDCELRAHLDPRGDEKRLAEGETLIDTDGPVASPLSLTEFSAAIPALWRRRVNGDRTEFHVPSCALELGVIAIGLREGRPVSIATQVECDAGTATVQVDLGFVR
jgi:hypothetical protein